MKSYENDYDLVIDEYKAFLDKYPNSKEAPAAIFRIVHCYQQIDDYEAIYGFIQELITDKKFSEIKSYAERHLISYNVYLKEYEKAISIADELLSNKKDDTDLYCQLLYEKGLIFKYQLEDEKEAETIFTKIVKEYPNHYMAQYAINELGIEDYGYKYLAKEKIDDQETAELSINNYPNPFNPDTEIRYHLPEAIHINLEIYNLLGQKIRTLIDGQKPTGSHTIRWDGRDETGAAVSSGVYLYTLTAGRFCGTRKMVVIR